MEELAIAGVDRRQAGRLQTCPGRGARQRGHQRAEAIDVGGRPRGDGGEVLAPRRQLLRPCQRRQQPDGGEARRRPEVGVDGADRADQQMARRLRAGPPVARVEEGRQLFGVEAGEEGQPGEAVAGEGEQQHPAPGRVLGDRDAVDEQPFTHHQQGGLVRIRRPGEQVAVGGDRPRDRAAEGGVSGRVDAPVLEGDAETDDQPLDRLRPLVAAGHRFAPDSASWRASSRTSGSRERRPRSTSSRRAAAG